MSFASAEHWSSHYLGQSGGQHWVRCCYLSVGARQDLWTRVGQGEGALASSLYTIPTSLCVFQDTDHSRFPPHKSSLLMSDAVASWLGFIMTLLLIMIWQFSLAQPGCHLSLLPVVCQCIQWGECTVVFCASLPEICHLLGILERGELAWSLQLCG